VCHSGCSKNPWAKTIRIEFLVVKASRQFREPALTLSKEPMTKPSAALLDLRNVRVMRGDNIVLDDFNLVIQTGEHVAILGPNGCGKSTLVKTISRECYPVVRDGSSMTILGQERWDVFKLRPMLGIVSNDLMTACTGDMTGFDIVLSGFFSATRIYPNHEIKPEQRKASEDALEKLRISHLAKREVREMSSGEARRVLIARALVHNPKTLLFDEPSNSLDFTARHSLRETMSLLAKTGVGIVMVTHDLADIVPEIERVVLMSKGTITADGHKDAMLRSERLSSLFEAPAEIVQKNGYYHLW
jgi:iron complex transport system ATP-binding protein